MKETFKIGVTGTQNGMSELQKTVFKNYLSMLKMVSDGFELMEFHHGDCIGVDAETHDIALERGIQIIVHPPNKKEKRAFKNGIKILEEKNYIERNHAIVDVIDLLFVIPKSEKEQVRSGTWATYRYAKKQEKLLVVIFPNGEVKIN